MASCPTFRRRPRAASWAAFAVLMLARCAAGQELPASDDMKTRVEKLEKELAELKEKSQSPSAEKAKAKEVDANEKPKDDKPDEKCLNLIPGQDRKLSTSWDSKGFTFKSADGDFVGHVGGRLMTDEVGLLSRRNWRTSPVLPLNSPLRLQTGVGPGIGDLQDGFFVRRARFVSDGTIYRMIEYKVEFDFENYNSVSFDESYVGAKDLPYFDAVRIGQMHVPFGLEAYTTSRNLPMLERSPLFDAFYQEFAPGIFTNMTFLDQRVTAQNMFHRVDAFSQFNGASFGDGRYAYSSRVSALPIYECEGRELLHVGLAYQWRNGTSPLDFDGGRVPITPPQGANIDSVDLIRFRSRQSSRRRRTPRRQRPRHRYGRHHRRSRAVGERRTLGLLGPVLAAIRDVSRLHEQCVLPRVRQRDAARQPVLLRHISTDGVFHHRRESRLRQALRQI